MSDTGAVISVSNVPLRYSSLIVRMPIAGMMIVSTTGVHMKMLRSVAGLPGPNVSGYQTAIAPGTSQKPAITMYADRRTEEREQLALHDGQRSCFIIVLAPPSILRDGWPLSRDAAASTIALTKKSSSDADLLPQFARPSRGRG